MLKSFAIKCFAALLLIGTAAGALAQEDPVAVQQQLFESLARVMWALRSPCLLRIR